MAATSPLFSLNNCSKFFKSPYIKGNAVPANTLGTPIGSIPAKGNSPDSGSTK